MLRVAALFRYPLKSAAGEQSDALLLDRFGVAGDRRWMIVDPDGSPITQREHAKLALLRGLNTATGLELRWEGENPPALFVPFPSADADRVDVEIRGHGMRLPVCGDAAAAWLSQRLGRPARLVHMPGDVVRPVNPRYGRPEDRTALTDGYPLHLIGSGSMVDLNDRLVDEIEVDRFRPNIYVEGAAPYDEDLWTEIRIGELEFRVVKPCPRCTVTTVDPRTGERGTEPLSTLARYRKTPDGVMFGQNVIHDSHGTIRVGDPVRIISRRDTPAV